MNASLYPTTAVAPGVGQLAARLARKFPQWAHAFVMVDPLDKTFCSAPGPAAVVGALADERPDLVLGLALGRVSRTVVVDIDSNVDFHMARFPATITARTPRPGRHLFYGPERGRLPATRWLRDVAEPWGDDVRAVREKSYEVLSDGTHVPLPPAPGRRWINGGTLSSWPEALDFSVYGR